MGFTNKEMIKAYPYISQSEKEKLMMNPHKLDHNLMLKCNMKTWCDNNRQLAKEKNMGL